MPIPRLVTIQAWSYSRFSTYDQCPRKAQYQYIHRLPEPDSTAGMKGTRVHAIAAMIATGKLPPPSKDNRAFYAELPAILKSKTFPEELATFQQEFKELRKIASVQVESDWAFRKDWTPCGWFDRDCWLRIKVDLHWLAQRKNGRGRVTEVEIRDHKTGKWSKDHVLQRSLYGLGAFLMYPDAAVVRAAHWYLDLGKEESDTWVRKDLPGLQQEWLNRTTAMLNDTTFAPRPSDKCRWCHFRKANGGPCEF